MTSVPPNWRAAFFALERKVSPPLQTLVSSEAGMDVIAVASRVAHVALRSSQRVGGTAMSVLGLPSARQVADLRRSIESLTRTELTS